MSCTRLINLWPPTLLSRQSFRSLSLSLLGQTTCLGFANFFVQLADKCGMGDKVMTVEGFCKGQQYTLPFQIDEPNHAWCMLKVEDEWYLCDPTWAAGGYGNGVCVQKKLELSELKAQFERAHACMFVSHGVIGVERVIPSDSEWLADASVTSQSSSGSASSSFDFGSFGPTPCLFFAQAMWLCFLPLASLLWTLGARSSGLCMNRESADFLSIWRTTCTAPGPNVRGRKHFLRWGVLGCQRRGPATGPSRMNHCRWIWHVSRDRNREREGTPCTKVSSMRITRGKCIAIGSTEVAGAKGPGNEKVSSEREHCHRNTACLGIRIPVPCSFASHPSS